jgi:hypothetical protein
MEKGVHLSKYDVAERVFCHHRTAQRVLKKLHEEEFCKISGWAKANQSWIPVYSIGVKRDKKMPKPLTPAEISKRYKEANPEYVLNEAIRRKILRREKCVGLSELLRR